MTGCPSLGSGDGVASIAGALRTIDCRTGEATAFAFSRLFGVDGRLMPVLTACLTLYVAFFAISLLTGRSRIGVSALTPRMLTLGLVLTFATSWAAYQNVIWTLASGAPDQIAGLLVGSHGSATIAFADRLDGLFSAIADAAHQAGTPGAPTDTGITPAAATVGGFSSATALWSCAIMLMLGTAGVLITAKIALAALLALGPLFVLLGLFDATRGLFEGWVKALLLFALVPLLAVLIGGGALGALRPLVDNIAASGGQPQARDVAVLFLGVCIYCVLMLMVLKTAGTMVAGWRLQGGRGRAEQASSDRMVEGEEGARSLAPAGVSPPLALQGDDRVRGIVAALSAPSHMAAGRDGSGGVSRARAVSGQIVPFDVGNPGAMRTANRRLQGVGSRFRAAPIPISKGHVS